MKIAIKFYVFVIVILAKFSLASATNNKTSNTDNELLNYGTINVITPQQSMNNGRLEIVRCRKKWGFPEQNQCVHVVERPQLNAAVRLPSDWYVVKFNNQFVPIFIFPERANISKQIPKYLIDFVNPTDQVIELIELNEEKNYRTPLIYNYRNDYTNSGMLYSVLFNLHLGLDSEFNKLKEKLFVSECPMALDQSYDVIKFMSRKDFAVSAKICQALQSPDPTNLLGAVLQVDDQGYLHMLEKTETGYVFTPLVNVNSDIAQLSQRETALVLPGQYKVKITNSEAKDVQEKWRSVTKGASYFAGIYSTDRTYKAFVYGHAENYLVMKSNAIEPLFWHCPKNFLDPIGAYENFSIDRFCRAIPVRTQTYKILTEAMRNLQPQYFIEIDELHTATAEVKKNCEAAQNSLMQKTTELKQLTARQGELNKSLEMNKYRQVEAEILDLEKQLKPLQIIKDKIKTQINQWLDNAIKSIVDRKTLEFIDHAYKLVRRDYLIGTAVVIGVGAAVVLGLASSLPAVAASAMQYIVIMSAVSAITVPSLMDKIKDSWDSKKGDLVRDIIMLKTCDLELGLCRARSADLSAILNEWNALLKIYRPIQNKLYEDYAYRKSESYSEEKLKYEMLQRELNVLLPRLESVKIDIEVLTKKNAIIQAEMQLLIEKANFVAQKLLATVELGIAIDDTQLSKKTQIVRRLNVMESEPIEAMLRDIR